MDELKDLKIRLAKLEWLAKQKKCECGCRRLRCLPCAVAKGLDQWQEESYTKETQGPLGLDKYDI